MSYGYVHMIWIVNFANGSVVASIPVKAAENITSFIYDNIRKIDITDDLFISPLKILADMERV